MAQYIDYAKVDTRPKTVIVEMLDAAINLLILFAFITLTAGILYMLS